jgi:uncharacterized protein YoxC
MKFDFNVNVNFNLDKGKEIMATLQEVIDSLDMLKSTVDAVDQAVEGLHAQIQSFINNGISPEVGDQLLAKVAEIKSSVEKVQTDD